ncbi:MAG: GTPase [Phycisphaerales bacterium]
MTVPTGITFTRLTPAAAATGAALSLYQLTAIEPAGDFAFDEVFRALSIAPVAPRTVGLRVIPDIDDALVTRPAPHVLHMSLHAGRAVERAFEAALARIGIAHAPAETLDPRQLYPEAASLVEACVLDALARVESPAAVDVLLAQPALWNDAAARPASPDESAQLDRLLRAPVVAAIGHANVGKSTLLNALARREAAIVADLPGTTLDHLGVTLTLDGVCVHWLDTPGWRDGIDPRSAEAGARALAARAVSDADLVLICGDANSGFLDGAVMGAKAGTPMLRIGTRAGLWPRGEAPACDLTTDALSGAGLEALAESVADRLVPRVLRARPPRWAFHPALRASG